MTLGRTERITLSQLVGQMLIADGELNDDERDYLDKVMAALELTDAERKQAIGGIDVDSPIEERVASLSDEARGALLTELETAMYAGGEVAPGEERMLARVKAMLGM
jgi:uncharacterized tellurite resistance protein B-like protein